MYETSIVFGCSNRIVVFLLYKHFISWLSAFFNSVSIIMNCTYATVSASDVAYVSNSFTFFKLAYYIYVLLSTNCLSLTFHLDCIRWCRFIFLTHCGKKSLWRPMLSYHQHNQSIRVTDGVTLSLYGSLLQQINMAKSC
jgi:hypothetical protein